MSPAVAPPSLKLHDCPPETPGCRLAGKRCVVFAAGPSAAALAKPMREDGASVVIHFPDDIECRLTAAIDALGGLDALVYLIEPGGDDGLIDTSTDAWSSGIDRSLTGLFVANRAAVGYFLARRQHGVIVNGVTRTDSSLLASTVLGGMLSFTRAAAQEFASRRIRINAIVPGISGDDAPGDAAAFLCADAAGVVTGAVLPVDF